MLKKGFTLAETIITLGIIGVVVAITTPIVIHSTAKAQVGPKLAKTVAIFEQANAAILQTNNSNSMLAKYYKNNAFDYEKYSADLNNYLKSNITANNVRFVPAAYAVKSGVSWYECDVSTNPDCSTGSATLNYDWSDGASYTYQGEIVKPQNPGGPVTGGTVGGGVTGGGAVTPGNNGGLDPCKFDPNSCECRCKGKTGEAYKSCCCEVNPVLCQPPVINNYCLDANNMSLPECQCENASNYQECICEKAPLTDGCGYNICNYLIPGTPPWESQCAELNLDEELQQIDFCRLNPHGRACKCQTLSAYSEEYRDLGCGGTSNEQSGRPSSPPEEKLDPIELPTNWAGLFVKDKSITLNNGISIAYEIKKDYIDAPSKLAPRKQRIGIVAIDINGIKNGKNEIAKDIFAFVMYNDGSLRPVGIYNWDGTQNDDLVWEKECDIGSEGGNPYCTGAIFENKFKVKYKY